MGVKTLLSLSLLAFLFFFKTQNTNAQIAPHVIKKDYGYTGQQFKEQLPENMRTLHIRFGDRKKDTLDVDVGRLMDSVYVRNIVSVVGEDSYKSLLMGTESFDSTRFVGKYRGTDLNGNPVTVGFYKTTSTSPEKKFTSNIILYTLNQGSVLNYRSSTGLPESESPPSKVNTTLMCIFAQSAEAFYPPNILKNKKKGLKPNSIALDYGMTLEATTVLNKELIGIIEYELKK
jgi:hypothetical protein